MRTLRKVRSSGEYVPQKVLKLCFVLTRVTKNQLQQSGM